MKTRYVPLLSLLMASSISFAESGDASSKAAARLMSNVEATARSLKSFRFDAVSVRTFGASAGRSAMTITENTKLNFMHPNYFDITDKDSNWPTPSMDVSDGKNLYTVSQNVYYKAPIDRNSADFHWFHNDLFLFMVMGSFDKAVEAPFPSIKTMLPDETFDGQTCKVVQADVPGGYPVTTRSISGATTSCGGSFTPKAETSRS